MGHRSGNLRKRVFFFQCVSSQVAKSCVCNRVVFFFSFAQTSCTYSIFFVNQWLGPLQIKSQIFHYCPIVYALLKLKINFTPVASDHIYLRPLGHVALVPYYSTTYSVIQSLYTRCYSTFIIIFININTILRTNKPVFHLSTTDISLVVVTFIPRHPPRGIPPILPIHYTYNTTKCGFAAATANRSSPPGRGPPRQGRSDG